MYEGNEEVTDLRKTRSSLGVERNISAMPPGTIQTLYTFKASIIDGLHAEITPIHPYICLQIGNCSVISAPAPEKIIKSCYAHSRFFFWERAGVDVINLSLYL